MNKRYNQSSITDTRKIDLESIITVPGLHMHSNTKSCKILQESIKENGLLTPIVARQMGSKFLLLDGAKRLAAWKKVFPDQQIPCTILIYEPSDRERGADTENFKDQMFCDAYTMNLAWAKVPTKIVESFVWKLHQSGIGYETIARYIGYKKSGIQKMIQRRKSEASCDGTIQEKRTLSKIKRARTLIRNIFHELNGEEDFPDLLDNIEAFLQMHEEHLQSCFVDTKNLPEDFAREQPHSKELPVVEEDSSVEDA